MELLSDLLFKGGVINIILWAAYGVALLVVFERLIFFLTKRGNYKKYNLKLNDQLDEVDQDFLRIDMKTLPYMKSFYYELTQKYQKYSQITLDEREKLMVIFMSECKIEMERGLTVLSIIGTLAPMLGLLGTMLGLVKSFRGIEKMGGAVDISILAGGIWEAMLTTIAGLIVGILALLALRVFQSRITLVSNRLDDLALYLEVKLSSLCPK